MKEFLAKLDLTPKKAIIWGASLLALTVLYIVFMAVLGAKQTILYGEKTIIEPYFIEMIKDNAGRDMVPFRLLCRLIFTLVYIIALLSVAVLFLFRFLKNAGKTKPGKVWTVLKISGAGFVAVAFVAIFAISIMVGTGNFFVGATETDPDGFDVMVMMEASDPLIYDYSGVATGGSPVVAEYDWSRWYYWFYWTLLPLNIALFAGAASAGVFGFLLPFLKGRKANAV